MLQVHPKETEIILKIASQQMGCDGDFVELGCYEGDTSLLLAEIVKREKRLFIYDSFEGLPEKGEKDFSESGKDFRAGELCVTKRYVKQRFLRANLPVPVIKKAWFDELDPKEDLPEKIAFAFLDGDLYDSIKTSLELVIPKMSEGGVVIVHDYNNPQLPGVSKAVDEFLAKNPNAKHRQEMSLAIITLDK